MGEEAARQYRRAQESQSSPEELRDRIAQLRAEWDLSTAEFEALTGIEPVGDEDDE